MPAARRSWAATGLAGVVAAVTMAGLVAACSSGGTPARNPSVPTFATTVASSVAEVTAVPKTCGSVAQASDVDAIVGHQLTGAMQPVVGVAMPAIHRTARLDCYYGLPAGQPVTAAAVQIAVASYTDAPSAQQRVTATVNSARDSGAATSQVTVAGNPAVLIVSAKTQELVFSHATLTILVVAATGVLPQGKAGPQLTALAVRALTAD